MSALAEEIRAAVREALREELPRIFKELRAPAPDALLSVEEAAKRLGLATATLYKLAAKCELPSVRLGRRVVFRPQDLDAYAEARRRSPERVRALAQIAA